VNSTAINITTGYQNGWAMLAFTGTNATTTGLVSASSVPVAFNQTAPAPVVGPAAATTFRGLPATGFMIRNFNNGTLSCTNAAGATGSCQGAYGSLFNHSYRNTILP